MKKKILSKKSKLKSNTKINKETLVISVKIDNKWFKDKDINIEKLIGDIFKEEAIKAVKEKKRNY